MNFIGVDPGKSGGIAVLEVGLGIRALNKLPVTFKLSDATERDIWDFVSSLRELEHELYGSACTAMIEKVASTPQMGVCSAFSFGKSLGFLRGVLTAAEIPFDEVSPQKWQKVMGCLTKGDKNISKAKAQQLFPKVTITHANADALLLAEYCRRVHYEPGKAVVRVSEAG